MSNRQPKHHADRSVFTFKGHEVYSTLIRCQFSPIETTGQRYVYTGSANGVVHIYDLVTGQTAGVLEKSTTRDDPEDQWGHYSRRGNGNSPCRDISWHPFMPVLASTEFNGNVNLWTLQNLDAEEKQKIIDQKQGKNIKSKMTDPESEEEEDSNPFGSGGGGGAYVLMRGPGGNHIRIPRALLMRLLNAENDDDEEDSSAQA